MGSRTRLLVFGVTRNGLGVTRNGLSTIRFKTLNTGGIGGLTKASTSKRRAIFNSIRKTHDIIILTETKFKASECDNYKREWNSGIYMSCTNELHAQAGVAILFRSGLAVSRRQGQEWQDSLDPGRNICKKDLNNWYICPTFG